MTYTLKDLIIASGYAGTAGQSFRNNVASAVTGAAMTDYKCTAWAFSGDPAVGTTYSDNASFTISITFTQGSRAQYIKRTGSSVLVLLDGIGPDYVGTMPTHNSGFQIASSSHTINAVATGTLSVTLRAPSALPSGYTGSAWFDGYTSPAYPTYNGVDADPIHFRGAVSFGSGAGTPTLQAFSISYAPDTGPFNLTLYQTFPITMFMRSTDTSTSLYDWEWHYNSSYTSLRGTGPGVFEASIPGNSWTYYLRAKPTGTSTWTNVGAVTFTDPR